MIPTSHLKIAWFVYLAFAVSPAAQAHHSPSEVVESLTHRIESGSPTAALLTRRGDEYRALADNQSAAADYHSALKLQPDYLPALHGLAHACFNQRRFSETIQVSQQGLAASSSPDQSGPFHALLARTYEQQEKWKTALAEWKSSLAAARPNINWYLGEARVLTKLNRHDDARLSLAAAIKRNPSTVLRRTWIKTLIACGQTNEAAQHIEAGLARSRWKSSWLLLRAQLELSQGLANEARLDAARALREIDSRLQPTRANPWLTADRQQALAILTD